MFIVPVDWISFRRVNWWIGYAVVFTTLYVWGVSDSILDHRPYTPLEIVQTIVNGLGIVAVWGLGLRRSIINAVFWKLFFAGDVCVYVLVLFVPGSPHPDIPLLYGLLFILVFYGPYYTGMYLYAFRSQGAWNPRKETNKKYECIQTGHYFEKNNNQIKTKEKQQLTMICYNFFRKSFQRLVRDMKRVHWIIATGVVALVVAHTWLTVSEPPDTPKGASQEELLKQANAHLHDVTSSIAQYLRCSVPAENSFRIRERLPSPSVWLHVAANANELATMRSEIASNGWIHTYPTIAIPVLQDVWDWNPPTNNVLSRQEYDGKIVRIWIAAEDEEKMYYCQFLKSQEGGGQKRYQPVHFTISTNSTPKARDKPQP